MVVEMGCDGRIRVQHQRMQGDYVAVVVGSRIHDKYLSLLLMPFHSPRSLFPIQLIHQSNVPFVRNSRIVSIAS